MKRDIHVHICSFRIVFVSHLSAVHMAFNASSWILHQQLLLSGDWAAGGKHSTLKRLIAVQLSKYIGDYTYRSPIGVKLCVEVCFVCRAHYFSGKLIYAVFLSFFLRQGLVAVRQQARLESKDLVQECVWCKRKRAGDGDRLIEGGGEATLQLTKRYSLWYVCACTCCHFYLITSFPRLSPRRCCEI